jgi:MipA family protein
MALALLSIASLQDASAENTFEPLPIYVFDQVAPDNTGSEAKTNTRRDDFEWMLGAAAINKPAYVGADSRIWEARPLWSVRYKRLTFSGPRASVGRTFADDSATAAGASYALFQRDRFRFNIGFRLDGGRKASDDPKLSGLPDIKRRGIYSLNSQYKLTDALTASASFASDVRSTETGSTFSLGLGYSKRVAPRWMWSTNLNATFADHHYMQVYHGVSTVPRGSTLTLFEPGGGIRDVGVSTTLRYQFDRRWVGFASVSSFRLLDDAAKSPLTNAKQQTSFLFGVAYNGSGVPFGF